MTLTLVGAMTLVLIVVIWISTVKRVRLEHDRAVAEEARKNDNLASAHEDRASRSIAVIDALLRFVRDDHLSQVQGVRLSQRIANLGEDARFIRVLSIIGPKGEVLDSSVDSTRTSNYIDRAYFRHHAGNPRDELLIGPPIIGRVSGSPVISLTRRVDGPDGSFAGVVFLSIDPAFFSRLYERSDIGSSSSLALVGLDGITRVRRLRDTLSYGDDISQSPLFEQLQRAASGHFVARSIHDGEIRSVSFRTLDAYPLVVVVASSLEETLTVVEQRQQDLRMIASAATVLLLAVAGLLVLVTTRRARSMAAIEGSERRYRLLFENSLDALLRTRPDGAVLAGNAAACQLLRVDEVVLRGMAPGELFVADDKRYAHLMDRLQKHGQARGRLTMKRSGDERFEAEISANVYVDADGQSAASLVVRDLTERMAAEAERMKLEEQLRQSQKLESMGTLAGGIAHDFNNILAAILGSTAIAKHDLADGRLSGAVLDRIAQAATRARSLVQQILTFSRRAPEERKVQPIQPLVEEAVALLRATLPATVRLEVGLAKEPLTVLSNATQLQQVILNLCTNAWQALPDRKGCVRVGVQVVDGPDGDLGSSRWLRLRVEDDGIGMSPQTQARLFEPFFTTKPVGEGTGLGLAVVHGIVAGHGGRIEVHSQVGHGSLFDVLLPLAGEAIAGPDDAVVPATRGSGERLLYVDDDEVVRITVEGLLHRLGYQVTTCSDARSACAMVKRDPAAFALVITDFNMPDMSGLDLAAQMLEVRPELPIVISSGYVAEDLKQRALDLGVRRVMMKEYTFEQLGGIVEEVLAA